MKNKKSEWIYLNLPYGPEYEKSFLSFGLNKPGTLIDTDDGIYLIGHINQLCGVCDCCTKFPEETIIKRYKIIWDEV